MWRFVRDGVLSLLALLALVSFCLPAKSFPLEEGRDPARPVLDRKGRVVALVQGGRSQASLAPDFLDEADLAPGQGRDGLRLSLDLGWQNRAKHLLASALANLRMPASAALVAIDARSREVWCLASLDSEEKEGAEGAQGADASFGEGDGRSPAGVESPWRLQLEPVSGAGGGSLLDWALEVAWLAEQGHNGPLQYVLQADMATTVGPASVLNGVLSLAMTRQDLRGRILTGATLTSSDGQDAWMVAAHQGVVVGVWFGLNQGRLEERSLSRQSEEVWQAFVQEWLRYGPALNG